MKKLILLLSVCLFVNTPLFAGTKDPAAVLFQVKGTVEYTKNGKSWRNVRRNKFLFDGYQIKTGSDGFGKITVKQTGENYELSPNSLFEVSSDEIIVLKGSITPAESSGKLVSGLIKKFDKSQSYTTVRRSAASKKTDISAVRSLMVTDEYPYLVWNNFGDEYEYEVTVGSKKYVVPATDKMFVRLKLEKFSGEQVYDIMALQDGETVATLGKYRSRGKEMDHVIIWMSDSEKRAMDAEVGDIQDTYGDNSFMLGSYFEKKDMWVASMEEYTQYLQENPDEIEMTPYLFRVYKKLQLNDIYKKELEEWKRAMIE